MHQFRLFRLLLIPSFSSLLLCAGCTGLILLFSNFSHLVQNQFFNDYASLEPKQLEAMLLTWQQELTAGASYVFDRPEVYVAVIALVAALIGLLVFACLEIITRSAIDAHDNWEEITFAHGVNKTRIEEEVGLRWLIRISAALLWVFYWGFWLSTVVLFSILLVRDGLAGLPAYSGAGLIFLGVVMLLLGTHLHVIFARLIALRPRLFGGRNAIEDILYDK